MNSDTPYKKSNRRAHMSNHDRAAQFASFAALDGHGDSIAEAARLTDDLTVLTEDMLFELSVKMRFLSEHISERPEINVTYFIPDDRKSGGKYQSIRGNLRVIDEYSRELIFTDGRKIPMDSILSLSGEVFDFDLYG